jgi:hypothetical protein
MATKQLVTPSGAVEQVNAKGTGIKVLGEWLNISQYHPIANMPTPGELVDVQVEQTDKGVWINSVRIREGGPSSTSASSSNRDREIRRMACLKAAADFCDGKAFSTEVSTADVLKVAEAFERWVTRGGEPTA